MPADEVARILTRLLCALRRRQGRLGVVTLWLGGGMGIAMVVERLDPAGA